MTANQRRLEKRHPGIFTRAGNYVASTVTHITTGSQMVDDATYDQRRALCNSCDKRDAASDTCTMCGCVLHQTILGDKLRRATSTCPLDKWSKQQ